MLQYAPTMFGICCPRLRCFFSDQNYTPKQTVAFSLNVAGSFHAPRAKHLGLILRSYLLGPILCGVGNLDLLSR